MRVSNQSRDVRIGMSAERGMFLGFHLRGVLYSDIPHGHVGVQTVLVPYYRVVGLQVDAQALFCRLHCRSIIIHFYIDHTI